MAGEANQDAAADNTADQGSETDEETGQDTDSGTDKARDEDEYTGADGWTVRYRKALFYVNEIDEHSVSFVYQGESAGTNMVTISYVPDKQPEEAMSELTEGWEAEEDRTEGIFPGTEDKWGYWRTLKTSGDNSGYGETVIGGEYNGGVLLFDIVSHKGDDEEQNAKVSDYIGGIIDSIQYEDFAPQTLYAYYPGTYEQSGQDADKTNRVVLNLSLQDEVDILWGSKELIAADGSFRYEFTIEGEMMMLNYDGNWLEFTRSSQNEKVDGVYGAHLQASDKDKIGTTDEAGVFYEIVYDAGIDGDELIVSGAMDYRNFKEQDPITISSDLKPIFTVNESTVYQMVGGEGDPDVISKEEFAKNLKEMIDSGLFLEVEVSDGVVETASIIA